MLKKTIWLVIVVLIATCSIFFTQTALVKSNSIVASTAVISTEQPKLCIEITSTPWVITATPRYTATAKPVKTATPTVVPTKTPTKTAVAPTKTKVALLQQNRQ
jgi:hypothetical protein